MRELSLREVQLVELEILQYFHDICVEHGLRYTLAWGTLLGAVREKGFIPWDDDVDVDMPRPDYEKFLKIIRNSSDSRFKLFTVEDEPSYFLPFAKLVDNTTRINQPYHEMIEDYGIFIDIFPVDGAGDDLSQTHKKAKVMKRLMFEMFLSKKFKKTPFNKKFPARKLFQKIGTRRIFEKQKRLALSQSFDNSKYVGVLVAIDGADECVVPRQWYEEIIDMEFEGRKFHVMKAYDEFLSSAYGDYMQRPPVEEQEPKHTFTAWMK